MARSITESRAASASSTSVWTRSSTRESTRRSIWSRSRESRESTIGWVIFLNRLRRSTIFSLKASVASLDCFDSVASSCSDASFSSVESLIGPHYGATGAQYTPALNCNVLNWPDHGGFSRVDSSAARVDFGVQLAANEM